MIKYDLIEIEPGHHAKLLKCFNNQDEDNKSNTVILIIPGKLLLFIHRPCKRFYYLKIYR
jgi:hypothetical protein